MKLTFHGGRELAAGLRRLPREVAEKWLERAVTWGANIVRDAAAAKAPRPAIRRRPGTVRLSDSIKTTTTEKGRSFVTVNVGTKVPYAHLVEYGHQIVPRGPTKERVSITTVRVSKKTGKQIVSTRFDVDPTLRWRLNDRRKAGAQGFVAPRPFMRPAFEENREAMIHRIAEVLRKGIEIEAKKMASRTPARAA